VPFAVCFSQLVLIWRGHYKFSRRYGLEDPYTVFLNVVLLFLVLFYVYPLKFVFTMLFEELTGSAAGAMSWQEALTLMRIYALGFTSVFIIFTLMYFRAYKLRDALGLNPVEVLETRMAVYQNIIMAVVGMVAFVLAFKNPAWSGWTYCLLAPVLTIHGSIAGKRVRLLAEKMRLAPTGS